MVRGLLLCRFTTETRNPSTRDSAADIYKSDTIRLIASSIKDVVFSQSSPESKLQIPPGVPVHTSNQAAMSTNGVQQNGINGKEPRFDSNYTDSVINAVGPNANPRFAQCMNSLTKHLHDWMRENEITLDEYMAGIDLVSRQAISVVNSNGTI